MFRLSLLIVFPTSLTAWAQNYTLYRPPSIIAEHQIESISIVTKAEMELGTAFDLREFHDVILTDGSVPLSILEQAVDRYIQSKTTT